MTVRGRTTFDGLDAFNTSSENGQSSNWTLPGIGRGHVRFDAKSGRCACWRWSRTPTAATARTAGRAVTLFATTRASDADPGRDPAPQASTATGNAGARPGGKPGHELSRPHPGRHRRSPSRPSTRNGLVLNMAQTWHQVRPGEVRTDCGGCHAHSQHAARRSRLDRRRSPATPSVDLVGTRRPLLTHDGEAAKPTVRGFVAGRCRRRRVLPRHPADPAEASCVPATPRANPDPPGDSRISTTSPSTAACPATTSAWPTTQDAEWGHRRRDPERNVWRQTNASRYVRAFQSRRSLLDLEDLRPAARRLDQRPDHPTESGARRPGRPAGGRRTRMRPTSTSPAR